MNIKTFLEIKKAVSDLESEEQKLRWRLEKINKRLSTFKKAIEDHKDSFCSSCSGWGSITVYHSCDDAKSETCKRCKGTGLKEQPHE